LAEEVEISNVGGENGVASEATLASLTRAIEKLAAQSGADPRKLTGKLIDLENKKRTSGIKVFDTNREALEEHTEEVKESTNAISKLGRGVGSLLVSAIGALVGTTLNFSKELLLGGDRLSDFSQHIPIIGSIITPLIQGLDNTIDNFRELTGVGVDFGTSLFDARLAAAQSGLSLETFTQTLKNNSEALALFYGGANAGARVFRNVSGIVQKDFGQTFSNLGMTMAETAEYTADYLILSKRLNRNQQISDQQLAQGTASYVLMLDKLSKITGKQRDQIAADLQDQLQDARIEAILGTLIEPARESLQEVLAITGSASPELNAAIKDMVATGGAPISDFARALANANPELAVLARGLRDGTVSSEEFMEGVRKAADSAGQFDEKAFAAAATAGNEFALAMLTIRRFSNVGKGATEAVDAQILAMEKGAQGLLDFERRITEIRNLLVGKLIESGVFDKLTETLNGFVDYFTKGEGLNTLKTAITDFSNWLSGLLADIQTIGIGQTITNRIENMLSALFSPTIIDTPKGPEIQKSKFDQFIENNIEPIFDKVGIALKSGLESLLSSEAAKTALIAGIGLMLAPLAAGAAVGGGAALAGAGTRAGMTAVAGGAASFANPATMLGLTMLTGAILGIATALNIAKDAFVPFGEMVKTSLEGVAEVVRSTEGPIKAALTGISTVIDSIGTAFKDIGTGVRTALEPVAGIITSFQEPIKAALTGISTVIDSIGTAFTNIGTGVRTALEPVAGIITSFQEPIKAALTGISTVIKSILDGISSTISTIGTTITDGITTVSDSIGNVLTKISEYKTAGVDATTKQITQLANIPGTNLLQAAEGIERMKTALEGFAPGFWSGLGSALSFETSPVEDLEKFAQAAPNLESIKNSLTDIVGITGLDTNINALRDLALDADNIENYADAISELVDKLEDLNEALKETVQSRGRGRERVTTGEVIENISANRLSEESIVKLNTTMQQILTILTQTKEIETRIERNTSSLGNNVASGRVSHIR